MSVETVVVVIALALALSLVLVVVGTLAVLAQALQAFVTRLESPTLNPGDVVWITALGQTRECVVTAVDASGTALVRPIGPDVVP